MGRGEGGGASQGLGRLRRAWDTVTESLPAFTQGGWEGLEDFGWGLDKWISVLKSSLGLLHGESVPEDEGDQ